MTINNCNLNPYPTSNPFNSRTCCNNGQMWNRTAFMRFQSDTCVPHAKPFSFEDKQRIDDIHVPQNNTIPMGCEGMMTMMPEFNDDIFQCPDGTLISKSSGRILRDNTKSVEFPGSKLRMINTKMSTNRDWNDRDIMNFDQYHQREQQVGLSKQDIEYSQMSKRESQKLKDNMSDTQKRLLNDLESGNILTLSKLVDESRK